MRSSAMPARLKMSRFSRSRVGTSRGWYCGSHRRGESDDRNPDVARSPAVLSPAPMPERRVGELSGLALRPKLSRVLPVGVGSVKSHPAQVSEPVWMRP
jgi:hypothetical protein